MKLKVQKIMYIVFHTAKTLSENTKQIFPEMKLRGLVPNFYIHVLASDSYVPTIGLPYSAAGK
jgi:hypothetical protein